MNTYQDMKDIKVYQELKDEAVEKYKLLQKNKNIRLAQIQEILEIYDVDPNINFFYLNQCLEKCVCEKQIRDDENSGESFMEIEEQISDDNEKITIKYFSEIYFYYINSLSLEQKIKLHEKIKSKKKIYNYLEKYINNQSNLEKIY